MPTSSCREDAWHWSLFKLFLKFKSSPKHAKTILVGFARTSQVGHLLFYLGRICAEPCCCSTSTTTSKRMKLSHQPAIHTIDVSGLLVLAKCHVLGPPVSNASCANQAGQLLETFPHLWLPLPRNDSEPFKHVQTNRIRTCKEGKIGGSRRWRKCISISTWGTIATWLLAFLRSRIQLKTMEGKPNHNLSAEILLVNLVFIPIVCMWTMRQITNLIDSTVTIYSALSGDPCCPVH